MKHGIQCLLLSISSFFCYPKSVYTENICSQKQKGQWPYKLSEVCLKNMNDIIEEVLKEVLSKFRFEREASRITSEQKKSSPYLIHP